MKVLEGAFNQEKTLVGAFSVIMKTGCGTDGALHSTIMNKCAWLPSAAVASARAVLCDGDRCKCLDCIDI